MIQLKGGFFLKLDVGGKKDFISLDELIEFTVVEHAGNVLPEFILSFVTQDESLMTMFHEGSPIKATYGKDKDSLSEVLCYTGKITTVKEGITSRAFTLNGLCVNQSYVIDHKIKTHGKKSGIEAVIGVLKSNFKKVESNITKSKETQVWIQPNITDKAFVTKTLMHSNLAPSFPVTAILANGTYLLHDALKIVKEGKPKYRIVHQGNDKNDIEVLGDGAYTSDTTFVNSWTGFAKVTRVLNMVSGAVESVSTLFKPIIASSKESEKLSGVTSRYRGFKPLSDSVHTDYWKTEDHNLVHLTQMSKLEGVHSFVDTYYPIKPLDLVMVKEVDGKTTSEQLSGLYFVTGVARTIQNKVLTTTVTVNREAVSALKNVSA